MNLGLPLPNLGGRVPFWAPGVAELGEMLVNITEQLHSLGVGLESRRRRLRVVILAGAALLGWKRNMCN